MFISREWRVSSMQRAKAGDLFHLGPVSTRIALFQLWLRMHLAPSSVRIKNTALPLHRRQTCARTHRELLQKRRARNTPIRIQNQTDVFRYADFNCVIYAHRALLIDSVSESVSWVGSSSSPTGCKRECSRILCRCFWGLWARMRLLPLPWDSV